MDAVPILGQFIRFPDLAAYQKGQLAPAEPGMRRTHVPPITSAAVFFEMLFKFIELRTSFARVKFGPEEGLAMALDGLRYGQLVAKTATIINDDKRL